MRLARIFYILGLVFLGAYHPKFGRYATYDWLGFMAVLLAFGDYLARARFPVLNRYVVWAGGLLVLGAATTVPHDVDPAHSAFAAVLIVYVMVIWMSLAGMLLVEWKHLHAAFIALGISASVTALYAIGQRLLGFPVLGPMYFWGRATGLTRHPNELGTFCAMVFPYLLCLAATAAKRRRRLIWTGGSLLTVLSVLLSGSMTGALALVAGVVGYFGLTNRRGRLRAFALILLGAIAVAGFTVSYGGKHTQFVVQRIESFLTSSHGKLTLDQRLVANQHALHYIESNPLQGHGYHSKVKSLGRDTEVHNTILRAWYDGGLFTLLGILVVLFGASAALADTWRRLRWGGDTLHKPYVAAAVGAFLALLVTMQASPILYQRSAWFPAALAFAVNLIVRRRVMARINPENEPGMRHQKALRGT